jgi:hypothetical protein
MAACVLVAPSYSNASMYKLSPMLGDSPIFSTRSSVIASRSDSLPAAVLSSAARTSRSSLRTLLSKRLCVSADSSSSTGQPDGAGGHDTSELHRTILDDGFWGIVSYNFDMVFETQSDRLNRIVYPDLMQQVGQFQRKGFFSKIHGCINGPASNLVLTRTGYEELRRHPLQLLT